MKCAICKQHTKNDKVCLRCFTRLRARIDELPALHHESKACIEPVKSGNNGHNTSGEPTIGINLTALDFSTGKPILEIMHEWEKLIREERQLTKPAFLKRHKTITHEIAATVQFHLHHLDWCMTQEWATDYAREIAELYAKGCIAARRDKNTNRRIACPATINDKTCNALIAVNANNLNETITCARCKTNWTTARMISVALNTPEQETWLDVEAIAQWCNLSEKQVRRIISKHKLQKRGQLIELNTFITHRHASNH